MTKIIESAEKTEQNSKMQRYEAIYLISNKYSENELEPIHESINELFQNNGGIIVTEENWGKRKLSYPIKHFYHAYYYLLEYDLPTENVQKIDNSLRLDERILRHLIVQKRIKTETEIIKEQKAAQRIAKEQSEINKTLEEKNAIKEKEQEEEKKEKKELNMAELDEKLDKILDDAQDLL